MPNRPRYYRKSSIPRESRTIKLPGDGTEKGIKTTGGELYRCWYCGFTCNDQRDALGDSNSGDGLSYTMDYPIQAGGAEMGYSTSYLSAMSILGGMLHTMVNVPVDASGSPKIEPRTAIVGGTGCPHCHTLNWRGDYP